MTVLTTDRVLVDIKTLLQFWFPRTVELFDEEQHRLETWRTGAANHRSTDRGRKQCSGAGFRAVELFDERHRLETWRTGAANHRSTDRGENSAAALVSAQVELFDEERHRLETWRTGAANHRSTDRGQENSAAALVSAHGGTLRRRTAQT
ncbi:hypothetical protein EVAR_26597_1 [Eumeta japonica]|uniref:Uncharacterized protein n=1 Tax=Eumeta variegata TaxID=151549 RepID=A0A4C1W516_EUMVA|nr:hypothetical protein EVAR_26597_1 [Eumeta japonica]